MIETGCSPDLVCVLGDFGPLALENRASLLPDSFDLLAEQASHSSTSRRCGPHDQLYCTKQCWNRHRGSIPLFSDLDMVILWIHCDLSRVFKAQSCHRFCTKRVTTSRLKNVPSKQEFAEGVPMHTGEALQSYSMRMSLLV
jgi:hypothetical protein